MTVLKFSGRRLQDLMDRKDWGDTKVAAETGLSRTMIYYLRVGRRKTASVENITKIADALGTTVGYLLGDDEDDGRVAMMLSEPVRRLADIANRLPDGRQEELLSIAATLETLERKRRKHPTEAMRALIEIAEDLKGRKCTEDLLPKIELLIKEASG